MADQAAVKACARAAYAPYIDEIGVAPAPLTDDYERLIGGGHVWVAAADTGQIVGLIAMFFEPDHVALDNAAVLPAWQARGVGKQLFAMAARAARRRGLAKFRVYTNAKMTRNLAIYRNHGFVEIDRRIENGFDRVFMERELAADEGWD